MTLKLDKEAFSRWRENRGKPAASTLKTHINSLLGNKMQAVVERESHKLHLSLNDGTALDLKRWANFQGLSVVTSAPENSSRRLSQALKCYTDFLADTTPGQAVAVAMPPAEPAADPSCSDSDDLMLLSLVTKRSIPVPWSSCPTDDQCHDIQRSFDVKVTVKRVNEEFGEVTVHADGERPGAKPLAAAVDAILELASKAQDNGIADKTSTGKLHEESKETGTTATSTSKEDVGKTVESRAISMECPVCFEGLAHDGRVPKVLPCGHTFCSFCIDQVVVPAGSCSLCRRQCTKDNITTNYALLDLLGSSAVSLSSSFSSSNATPLKSTMFIRSLRSGVYFHDRLVPVPDNLIGRIIGKGGVEIKRFEEVHNLKGARVTGRGGKGAGKDGKDGIGKAVQLSGSQEDVATASRTLEAFVQRAEQSEDVVEVPALLVGLFSGRKLQALQTKLLDKARAAEDVFACLQATHWLKLHLKELPRESGLSLAASKGVALTGTGGAVQLAAREIKAQLESSVGILVEVPICSGKDVPGLRASLSHLEEKFGIDVDPEEVEMGEAWKDALEVSTSTAIKVTIASCQSQVDNLSMARDEALKIAVAKLPGYSTRPQRAQKKDRDRDRDIDKDRIKDRDKDRERDRRNAGIKGRSRSRDRARGRRGRDKRSRSPSDRRKRGKSRSRSRGRNRRSRSKSRGRRH